MGAQWRFELAFSHFAISCTELTEGVLAFGEVGIHALYTQTSME